MVLIPGGTFQMGDSFAEGESGERPIHTVTLDSFYMGKYEITNHQYCDFLNWADDNGWITVPGGVYQAGSGRDYPYCHTSSDTFYGQITYSGGVFSIRKKSDQDMSHYPIVNVTWYGAAAYCNWRSQQEGREQCYNLSMWNCDFSKKGYRLPTEAEWEYAARGGLEGKRFPWGDTISHSQANYISHWEGAQPYYSYDVSPTRSYHPTWNDGMYPYAAWVGFFAANGYGLYDMAGNAQELCNDWYSRFYYSSSPVNNPRGPTSGASRALRGGSWYNDASYSRVAKRSPYGPIYGDYSVGFRVALPN